MPDVIMVVDPGSSHTKIFVQIGNRAPQLILMEPEVICVGRETLEAYEREKLGNPNPEDSAWVSYDGQCWAVGYLARKQFLADPGLKELKYGRAVYKVLAAVGVVSEREGLPSHYRLRLGVLLPRGEYKNKEFLENILPAALANFSFRFQPICVELERFECKPEGGGLALVRRRELGVNFTQRDAIVIVIGYRNASWLALRRGNIDGDTSDLGFARLIEKVQSQTAGQKAERLIPAIIEAGSKVSRKPLESLALSQDKAFRKLETTQIVKAVNIARADYWQSLISWFQNNVPLNTSEVILTGGTANYWRSELETFFSYASVLWYEHLEKPAIALPCNRDPKPVLNYRLTDGYGFFLFLVNIPCRVAKSA